MLNMSRFLHILLALAIGLSLSIPSFAGIPDPDEPQKREARDWHDRMMSEKIAFFTAEMDLTPSEAEKFWPVYNQLDGEQQKLFKNIGDSFFALQKAVDSKASEKEITNKLNAYIKAQDESNSFQTSQLSRYEGIISKDKIAKMVIAEEKFRRQQISRLHRPAGMEDSTPKDKNP